MATTPKWHEQPLIALDTETTGVNPTEARIVTAAVVHMTPGQRPRSITWVINPGPVPDEAAEVHGWTTQRLLDEVGPVGSAQRTLNGATRPIPADVAVFEITAQVASAIGRGAAVVVHNAAYDLTLLEAENQRYDVPTIASRPAGITGVVDPMVIEKQHDQFRKVCYKAPGCDSETRHHECGGCRGSKKTRCGGCGATDRTLTSLCQHYGIRHAGAHDADADAVAAVRLLHKLVAAWPQMGSWRLPTLHQHQVTWRREQQDGLRSFFDRVGKEHDGCCGSWPVHSAACAAAHRQVEVAA